MAFLKGWRTIAFNLITVIIALAGVGLAYVGELDLTGEQELMAALGLTFINQVGNIILRFITTTPVGKKEPKTPDEPAMNIGA